MIFILYSGDRLSKHLRPSDFFYLTFRLAFLLSVLLISHISYSQDIVEEEKDIENAEFLIEKESTIELPQALRLYDNMKKKTNQAT